LPSGKEDSAKDIGSLARGIKLIEAVTIIHISPSFTLHMIYLALVPDDWVL
jgi:hypothetical protein